MIIERVRKDGKPDVVFKDLSIGEYFTFDDIAPYNIFQKIDFDRYKNIQGVLSHQIHEDKIILPVKIERIIYSLI